jgi:hypothetical protein
MGINASRARQRAWPHRLAGGAVAAALALAAPLAWADEGGVSFWTPGTYASLSATLSQPGFALQSTWYHSATTAGSAVARARLIRIGRIPAEFATSVTAISRSPADSVAVTPSYTFATPVLGGQAAVGLTAIYGRTQTTNEAVIDTTRFERSFEITRSRFDTISDTVWGFGDMSPQFSLRWNAGVHNVMTYVTGNIPVGAYDPVRLSNIGIGFAALDAGVGYTYLNEQTGLEFSAVAGATYNFVIPTRSIRTASMSIWTGARRAPSPSSSRSGWWVTSTIRRAATAARATGWAASSRASRAPAGSSATPSPWASSKAT